MVKAGHCSRLRAASSFFRAGSAIRCPQKLCRFAQSGCEVHASHLSPQF
jgi:hypothetical protein